MIELQFNLVERGNASITFPHPVDRAVLRDLARQPGVLLAEGQRIVPVRLRAGGRDIGGALGAALDGNGVALARSLLVADALRRRRLVLVAVPPAA